MRKYLLAGLLFVFVVPQVALSQQITAAWTKDKDPNSSLKIVPLIAWPNIYFGRASVSPIVGVGIVLDDKSPTDPDHLHVHPTWMWGGQFNYRLLGNSGPTVGYGWTRVPQGAKTHLRDYKGWFFGWSFDLRDRSSEED